MTTPRHQQTDRPSSWANAPAENGSGLRRSVGRWPLLAGAVFVLSLYLVATELWPRAAQAVDLWRTWRANEARIESGQGATEQVAVLRAEERLMQARFTRLAVRLPRRDQMSAILEGLRRRAEASGVRLVELRPSSVLVQRPTFDELPLEIELAGPFHGIGRFVDQVERSEGLIRVEALRLVRPERTGTSTPITGGAVLLRARLRLRVSVQRSSGTEVDSSASRSDVLQRSGIDLRHEDTP